MKLKGIAATFRKHKQFTLYTAPSGEQWIGDYLASYKLEGLPKMTAESLLVMFDIPADKREEWQTEEKPMSSDEAEFSNTFAGEEYTEMLPLRLEFNGELIYLFAVENEIYGVNEDYIKPLYPFSPQATFNLRRLSDAAATPAFKTGLFINASIYPVNIFAGNSILVDAFADVTARAAYMRTKALHRVIKQQTETYGDGAPDDEDTL
jgi:hypothetical protein